jgi:hypothetical protein
MWTPNITTPVVKLLSHRGPVNALAFDPSGHYMATAGVASYSWCGLLFMVWPLIHGVASFVAECLAFFP